MSAKTQEKAKAIALCIGLGLIVVPLAVQIIVSLISPEAYKLIQVDWMIELGNYKFSVMAALQILGAATIGKPVIKALADTVRGVFGRQSS
jgi:hypothetical protein